MITELAQESSGGIPAETPVFAARPLRPGWKLEDTARFGDDEWDLTPALLQKQQKTIKLAFHTLPPAYRQVAKEMFYALLALDPPPGETKLSIQSIRGRFSETKYFLTWLESIGSPRMDSLDLDVLDRFHRKLVKENEPGSPARGKKRRALRTLFLFRHLLAVDHLVVDPAELEGWKDDPIHRAKARENSTERIPEPVLAPLVTWALRLIDNFADDIMAARDEYLTLFRRSSVRRDGRSERGEASRRLIAVLDDYRANRRPLPRTTVEFRSRGSRAVKPEQVNVSHLARQADCHRDTPGRALRQLVDEVAAEVGIDDDTYLSYQSTALLDGQPWIGKIAFYDLPKLARLLHTACYIVAAYLSGMRDSEVKHMRRGCLSIERDSTGMISRRRVTSQAFKGEGTPLGVEATWVVAESVARAIAVAERLQLATEELLFAPLPTGTQFNRARAHEALSNRETNDHLVHFIDWVNDYCRRHGRADGIPVVNGQRWTLRTSQFRRTLAWFIARRPGGAIAGAIHYRHHGIQMFEGYAGTSQSGFRAEVEGEQALARGEHLAMKVERHEHTQLSGPSAQEAADRLEEFGGNLRFRGIVPDSKAQFLRLMKRHDPHVYPGEFVTCVWRPDRALCRHEAAQADGPDLPECKPLECRNVALDAENAERWREFFARLEAALADGATLAPYVRHRLQQRHEAVARFLDNHLPEASK